MVERGFFLSRLSKNAIKNSVKGTKARSGVLEVSLIADENDPERPKNASVVTAMPRKMPTTLLFTPDSDEARIFLLFLLNGFLGL